MSRVESDVQAGKAGKKGAATQAPNDQPIAPVSADYSAVLGAHELGDGAAFVAQEARISRPSENKRQNAAGMGGGNFEGLGRGLRGHIDAGADAALARGNQPVRSKGKPTQESDREKLSTAGS
jgi:hypothetical protein